MPRNEPQMDQADIDKTHPGFTVTCDKCRSTQVIVTNTQGHSAESGSWGAVSLECLACGETCEVAS